jgi:CRISPR-associated protein Cmr4
MPNTVCYLIECLTNLHAGSGDSGVGIIDKMVQRDPVTELPVIYASSLKGAFREYFEEGPESAALKDEADKIFGPKNHDDDANRNNGRGTHVFHEAQLLALPLGSNKAPYYLATSKLSLQLWLNKAKLLLATLDKTLEKEVEDLPDVPEGKPKILGDAINGLYISDFENVGNHRGNFPKLKALLGNHMVLLHHNDFKEQCSDYNLPVIARNNLENGESKNLWYEQIVPHRSIFSFFTYTSLAKDNFLENIRNKVVQIGANSSLGYGYCKIKTL